MFSNSAGSESRPCVVIVYTSSCGPPVGDWPNPDFVTSQVIDLAVWEGLEDQGSVLVDPVCFAWDVSPERQSSIAAAGRNEQGNWHVEIVDNRAGTGWVAARVAELAKKHETAEVVCDGYGPAARLIPTVEELGVEVTPVDSGGHGRACGRFVDAVEEGTLRHRGSSSLGAAIRAARTRPLSDAWAWSRKDSTANISPLVSATLALSAAMTVMTEDRSLAWL